jgi:hypothetical protein
MPKRSRNAPKKQTSTRHQLAFDIVKQIEAITSDPTAEGKDPLAVLLGRRGGLKGGRARADGMTKDERRASAIKAAHARWRRRHTSRD